ADQRLPARGARRARPLDPGGLGRLLPRLRAGPRALHLVEPAARRARPQHRLAHRLRAGLARGDALRAPRLPPARGAGLRSLPGRRRDRPGGDAVSAEPTPAPAPRAAAEPRLGRLGKAVYASGDFTINTSLVALSMIYTSWFLIQIAEL